jgi:DNA-binding IclR family transcriptional regulator
VDLSVLSHSRALFIDQVVAPHRLRAVSAVGAAFPLHCTANGKAFLAALPPPRLAGLSGNLDRLTPHTITEPAVLERELEQVRADGVAYDREEHTAGICAVAAIVRELAGIPLAVSVPMPAQRFYGRSPFSWTSCWPGGTRRTRARQRCPGLSARCPPH